MERICRLSQKFCLFRPTWPNACIDQQIRWKSVRIGCASGFFGDTTTSVQQLVTKGKLDYLVMDYLSEITMSLLVGAQKKNPALGFIPDFVQQAAHLKVAATQGVKVVANAGGINPQGCADALRATFKDDNIRIAVVTGDNILEQVATENSDVREMKSGASLPSTTNSATAYLGAGPIVAALQAGADIVITGRCTDSALALGPLIYSHGWALPSPSNSQEDLDRLASGSLAGHLIECGAQATGGIFTDWDTVSGWDDHGFPIVTCEPDGSFLLSKPENTGGLVTPATVKEQLLYEIHDPANYILPDVNCDFTRVIIEPTGESDEVLVTGAVGKKSTANYKVCATYADGYRLTAVATVIGPRTKDKALKTGEAILARVNRVASANKIAPITDYYMQVLGSEAAYGTNRNKVMDQTREGVLWLAAKHHDKRVLDILSKEIAPAGTGMAPGLTAIVGGRPKVSPIFKLFSFLYPKSEVQAQISLDGKNVGTYTSPSQHSSPNPEPTTNSYHQSSPPPSGNMSTVRLGDLVYTRSGDKGNDCNIGVICRDASNYPLLKKYLTSDTIAEYFSHTFQGEPVVERYELPGVQALNFVLRDCLGGGGIASLRFDPQGKAYGQMLLDLELKVSR